MTFLSKNWSTLRDSGPTMSRVAVGGAWLFIVVSLLHLLWVCAVKLPDPSGLTTLYQTTVDGETHRAPLLAYRGWPGLILAWLEGVAVLAAAVMSILPIRRARRIGHATLLIWVAIWTVGLVYLALLDPGDLQGLGQAAAMIVFAGCSLWRWRASERRWARRNESDDPPRRIEDEPAANPQPPARTRTDRDSPPEMTRTRARFAAMPIRIVGRCCRKVVRSVRSRRGSAGDGQSETRTA